MSKLAFSNIFDDALYGTEKSGRKARYGRDIKKDIIKKINLLTQMGVNKIRDKFYTKLDSGAVVLNQDNVRQYMKSIIQSNGLGVAAEDLLEDNNVVSSLIQRTVFEQSVSSLVNSEVIDIVTNGGTAIQQSIYGFAEAAYGNQNVQSQNDDYTKYNDGKELKWNAKEGSMEVLLSMNFFKTVVPADKQGSYAEMRQWLIDNDVIKGTKSDGTKSNPKPFGIGYRIPTQGMSSIFGFIVADVLPEHVGDLIIVPREFTAQTGSDFDVDKLYLATYSYKDGVRESYSGKDDTTGGIANSLLDDYLDIISDRRNFANARASIDTVTNIIQNELLSGLLRTTQKGYRQSMS
uniref:Capsid protein n=1 Tax=Dulem virus 42 TaxID=3145760 RepID=A0AAU8B7P9_9CAUD